MLFFDLEFYVPEKDRHSNGGSLIFNPTSPDHLLLGGHFIAKNFNSSKITRTESYWLWNFDFDEARLINSISQFFTQQWAQEREQKEIILNKKVRDLVVVGFRVQLDLMTLFLRAERNKIKSSNRLFEIFLKPKIIDLANVASMSFPEENTFYPKSMNEVIQKLQIGVDEKEPGRNVWYLYDQHQYSKIEQRTKEEVEIHIQIYEKLQRFLLKTFPSEIK
jgi:hypothetical protein